MARFWVVIKLEDIMSHKKLPSACEVEGCYEDGVTSLYDSMQSRYVHLCLDCLIKAVWRIKGFASIRCPICKTRFILVPDKTEVKP